MSRSILLTQSKSKMYTEKYMQRKYVETMNFRPVECSTLKKIIYQLKNTGAVGTDGISVLLLKKDVLAPFITWIINLSIMSFKVGVISPVPKSSDLNEMKNWRPVVILNAMSMCLERVLNHQIKEHLERFNLLLGCTFWICQPPSILFTSQS